VKRKQTTLSRNWRAGWRDSWLLMREFRAPLAFFFLAMAGCGLIFYFLAMIANEPVGSLTESVYLMLTLTFLQPSGNFPTAWYLQVFFFIMPLIGLGILAQGLTDFSVLFFNRKARGKEWEMAVASTYNHHTVLIGLGHLGFRVLRYLHDMGEAMVVIELNPEVDLVASAKALGVPVIADDGTREKSLDAAGIQKAKCLILCTQNDSLNLQMAIKARSLNPSISIVMRTFDEDLAVNLEKQFGFKTLSATGLSAPMFAASAMGIDITPPINIEGQPNHLTRIGVSEQSSLREMNVQEIEDKYKLSVVFYANEIISEFHPSATLVVHAGDMIAAIGPLNNINALIKDNQSE
jgi:voltage-gated potassium channel